MSPMHPRAAFRISLAAGLLVLAVTLMSATNEPARPCGNLPQNYAPIIAFELARSAADLEAIFGTQEPCRSAMVERMDAVNLVDVLVYIPAYGVFMACFFLGMRARHAALGTLGFRIAIVAVLGDYAENACLMSLTPQTSIRLRRGSRCCRGRPPSSGWVSAWPQRSLRRSIVQSSGARALNIVAGAGVCCGIPEHRGSDRDARDVRTAGRPRRRAELADVPDHGGRGGLPAGCECCGTAPTRMS